MMTFSLHYWLPCWGAWPGLSSTHKSIRLAR